MEKPIRQRASASARSLANTSSLELKKHVNAIHCANSMSLLQRKIANALLFNAYDRLLLDAEHEISISYLCKLIGYSSHDYQSIKTALIHLISTVVEWNLVQDGSAGEEWNASSIIASASIKGGLCYYAYSPSMKRLLHTPAMYGRLNMTVQALFKSSYGLALYENCIRYQNLKYTPWFNLVIFRQLMGVEPSSYTVFRDFKRRVLDKAVQEVNEHTAMVITPEVRRHKRQVIALRFAIYHPAEMPKKLAQPTTVTSDEPVIPVKQLLCSEFCISSTLADKVLAQYSAVYIEEKINTIKQATSYKQGKIHNLAAYLMTALQEDYQLAKPATMTVQANYDAEQLANIAEKAHAQQFQHYEAYVREQMMEQFQRLPAQLQTELPVLFKKALQATNQLFLVKCMTRYPLDHPTLAVTFRRFVNEQYPGIFSDPLSFSDYCAKVKAEEVT